MAKDAQFCCRPSFPRTAELQGGKLMKNHRWVVSFVLLLSFFMACGNTIWANSAPSTALAPDATLEITGPDIRIILTAEEMLGRTQTTLTCKSLNSAGNFSEAVVTGFSLHDLLAENGIDLAKVSSMNFVASDGYVMAVPAEVYADHDVYILLNMNGQDLTYPRSCLPEQRSMYWVKGLIKIELTMEEPIELASPKVTKISFFREAIQGFEGVELHNRGTKVTAYPLARYFAELGHELPTQPVTLIARDGFQKTETAKIFLENHVTLEAELGREADLPLYFSEDLKPGMKVKQLDLVIAANDAVYFGLETTVSELFELAGMVDAESYLFVANDGYAVEIPAAAIPFGKIYPDEKKGYLRAEFTGYSLSELPGKGKVKYLTTIEAVISK